MKISYIFPQVIALLSAMFAIAGCKEEVVPETLKPVEQLLQPAAEARVELSETGSLLFEWEAASGNESKSVLYELLFDRADGDFSQPLQSLSAESNGSATTLTVSHQDLDRVAELAGAGSEEKIILQWAVLSKAGDASVLSSEYRALTLVRLHKEKPEMSANATLHISGSGAEEGQAFKAAINEAGNTTYEIYTRLEAGQPYWLYSLDGDAKKEFSLNAEGNRFEVAAEGAATGATVATSGVYRLQVDFATTSITRELIEKLTIRVSQTGRERVLDYVEKGTWKVEDYNVCLSQQDWGIEERYKFILYVDGQEEHWGQAGSYDDRPSINMEGYRDMAPTESGQWGGMQFKFPIELCDREDLTRYNTDITVYLTADKNYTHEFTDYYFHLPSEAKFTNAVFTDFSLPDPDVIRGDDGLFYLYATEHSRSDANMKNSPIMRSKDLVHWERIGSLFTDDTHPQITNGNAGIWAPTISKVGDQYVVYYSQPGDNYKHAIGVATAPTPAGPFTDHGKLIDSNEQGVDISIDAFLYQENGRNYLFWGSFREISVIELTADGLSIKPGETRKVVAGGQYEASYVHKKYGYYYLIVSTGNYAKYGTYSVVVGRSRNITGPYVNKAGKDMKDVNHEVMLKGNSVFSSPGHSSRIITDDAGNDWILYHAYPNDKDYRCLMLDQVTWENEWPVINTTYPSTYGYTLPQFN